MGTQPAERGYGRAPGPGGGSNVTLTTVVLSVDDVPGLGVFIPLCDVPGPANLQVVLYAVAPWDNNAVIDFGHAGNPAAGGSNMNLPGNPGGDPFVQQEKDDIIMESFQPFTLGCQVRSEVGMPTTGAMRLRVVAVT